MSALGPDERRSPWGLIGLIVIGLYVGAFLGYQTGKALGWVP